MIELLFGLKEFTFFQQNILDNITYFDFTKLKIFCINSADTSLGMRKEFFMSLFCSWSILAILIKTVKNKGIRNYSMSDLINIVSNIFSILMD